MPALTEFIAWFAQNAAIRTLTGVLFFALLGYVFIRLTGKLSLTLYFLLVAGLSVLFFVSPVAHLFAFAGLLIWMTANEVRRARLRRPYEPAVTLVESGGIKRGLTPAEAAVLLEMPVGTVAAVTLLGLLRKGALVVKGQTPLIFEVAAPLQVKGAAPGDQADLRRRAAQSLGMIIQPYEETFLMQIEAQDGEPVRSLTWLPPFGPCCVIRPGELSGTIYLRLKLITASILGGPVMMWRTLGKAQTGRRCVTIILNGSCWTIRLQLSMQMSIRPGWPSRRWEKGVWLPGWRGWWARPPRRYYPGRCRPEMPLAAALRLEEKTRSPLNFLRLLGRRSAES